MHSVKILSTEEVKSLLLFTIVAGGFVLNLVPGTWRLNGSVVLLMLLSSSIIALIYFFFKDVANEGNFWAAAFWMGWGMALAASLLWIGYKPYRRQFNSFIVNLNWKVLTVNTVNEVSATVSVLCVQAAVMMSPSVATVTALNAYQPIFILIIGWLLAKGGSDQHAIKLAGSEFWKKSGAIILIALGTVFISHM